MTTDWKREIHIRIPDSEFDARIEVLRQETFSLYASIRGIQRASPMPREQTAQALRDVALLTKRVGDDVRRLRVDVAMDDGQEVLAGVPI